MKWYNKFSRRGKEHFHFMWAAMTICGMFAWVFCFGMLGVTVGEAFDQGHSYVGKLTGVIVTAVVCMGVMPPIVAFFSGKEFSRLFPDWRERK